MKTTLLIFSLLLTGLDLWAQNTPPMTTNAAPANRDAALRRALRRAVNQETNVTVQPTLSTVPPAATEAATSPENSVTTEAPSVPGTQANPNASPAPISGSSRIIMPSTGATAPKNEPADMDQVIPQGMTTFVNAALDQVLDIYARLVGRTLLRPANLTAPPITFKAQTPLTKRETIQALDTILGMSGIAVLNVGEKFAKVVPTTQANAEAPPWTVTDPADLPDMGQYVTYVLQLTYVKPSEMAQVLAPFQKTPNAALGIDTSQILILRDYTENVKRMLEMVKQVDVAVPAEIVSEVIPIKYALASDIAAALNSVSSGTSTTTVGASGGSTGPLGSGGFNGGRGGSGGLINGGRTTTTYGGVGAQANTSRFGGAGNANPNIGGGGAQPGTFGDRIRAIINRAATGSGGANGEFQILGQTKVIADERTNSLLIFATRQDMDMIKSIIDKLDVVLAQVLIEAIIIDVTLGNGKTIGVSAAQEPRRLNGDLTGGGGMNNGQSFLDFLGAGTNALNIGSFLGSLPSGFSYFGRLDQGWDFTLSAIANDNRVNVLSRPRIQTSHAVPATIFIGQTVPYINGTVVDINGGNRSSYEQRDIGINLSVLPLINPDGLVVMDIQEDIEQLGDSVLIDGNLIPKTVRRSATAKVAVKDGDTIVLGGFISTTKSKSQSGVPFLSDVPLLGYLFRKTVDSNDRTELAVLMHPRVLPTPEVAAIAAMDDQRQMPGVLRAKKEIGRAERKAVEEEQRREFREETPVNP